MASGRWRAGRASDQEEEGKATRCGYVSMLRVCGLWSQRGR